MLKTIQLSEGKEKYCVNVTATITGDGLIVQLTGGDKPHVGAVVMSLPRPSLKDASDISCTSYVLPRLGHKDDEVAKPIAEELSRRYNIAVVVVAGIHIENATESEIKKVLTNADAALQKLIAQLEKHFTT
ncbi:proteasome assembly chaperone 4 family protein [Peptococcaceae bacterium]|nr:proteasome assembly chaperone 4 family protein [Peptococcaceae bacterium]